MSALHKRRYIETAQRFSDVPKLTTTQIEAMNLIDKLCNHEKFCFSIKLIPGDLEIASNATTFHSERIMKITVILTKKDVCCDYGLLYLMKDPCQKYLKTLESGDQLFKDED